MTQALPPPPLPPSISHRSILLQILRARIPNPILINRKETITLRQTRTIINLTDPRLAPALLETQSRRARVRDDIATDRFLRVGIEHGARPAVDLGDDLIRDDDRDAELVREPLQRAHEFRQVRLARGEFAAADEIRAVEAGRGVDDEQREARLAHHLRRLVQQLELMVGIVGPGVRDVVEHLFARKAVAVGDGEESHGAEGAFGVDV